MNVLYSYISKEGLNGLLRYKRECNILTFRNYVFPDNNYNSILHFPHTYDTAEYLLMNENCEPNVLNDYALNPVYYQTSGKVIKLMIQYGLEIDILPLFTNIPYFIGNKDNEAIKYLIDETDSDPFIYMLPIKPSRYNINEYINPFLINSGYNIYQNYFINSIAYNNNLSLRILNAYRKRYVYCGLHFIRDVNMLEYIFNHPRYRNNIKELLNNKNIFRENILFETICPKQFEVFLKYGANSNTINISGYNLLQYHSNLDIIKLLLKYGANVNYRNPFIIINYSLYSNKTNNQKLLNVYNYHKYNRNYKVYKYLKRYIKCLLIQRNWRLSINKKKEKDPKQCEIFKNLNRELIFQGPLKNIKSFPGGIEYQESLKDFMSLCN